ncbi:WD repeat-containing protein 44 [Entophlyctis luteolus]|nr:WD repeat-containing protein 44 [Entophlyctis luteolus]
MPSDRTAPVELAPDVDEQYDPDEDDEDSEYNEDIDEEDDIDLYIEDDDGDEDDVDNDDDEENYNDNANRSGDDSDEPAVALNPSLRHLSRPNGSMAAITSLRQSLALSYPTIMEVSENGSTKSLSQKSLLRKSTSASPISSFPKVNDVIPDDVSGDSKDSASTMESVVVKKKSGYLQKLSFGLRTTAVKAPQTAQLQPSHHSLGFKMARRVPSAPKGLTLRVEEDREDDEQFGSSRYIRGRKAGGSGFLPVKAKNKSAVELSRLKRIQTILSASVSSTVSSSGKAAPKTTESDPPDQKHTPVTGSILAMKFSAGGKYLATGGADNILRIWEMSTTVSAVPVDVTPLGFADGEPSKNPPQGASPKSHADTTFLKSLATTAKYGSDAQKNVAASVAPTVADSGESTHAHSSSPEKSVGTFGPSTVVGRFISQVVNPAAHRTFVGHSAPILDLAWSKTNFILSASSDKTVRLWHVRATVCLKVFNHDWPVTAVRFHPNDEQLFLTGCGSQTHGRLRMWSISEKKVKYWVALSKSSVVGASSTPTVGNKDAAPADTSTSNASAGNGLPGGPVHPLITAVEFSADGSLVITGTADGCLYFHEANELKYNTRVDLMAVSNSKSFRITGIEYVPSVKFGKVRMSGAPPILGGLEDDTSSLAISEIETAGGAGYVLVTATDSRVRLFNLRDKSLVRRYRGPDIRSIGWVRAVGTDDGRYAICGSEDAYVYLWNLDPNSPSNISPVAKTLVKNSGVEALGNFDQVSGVTGKTNPLSGVISGFMHWDQSRLGHFERFAGSDCPITCAIFAPSNLRSILSLDQQKNQNGIPNLAGAFIFVADVMGNIHVFENEIPPWQIIPNPTPSADSGGADSRRSSGYLTKSANASPAFSVKNSFSDKRNFTAPPIATPYSAAGIRSNSSPYQSAENSPDHSPEPLETLTEMKRPPGDANSSVSSAAFGISSRDIYFAPKMSTAKEAPVAVIPELLVSSTEFALDVPAASSRRRSYSSGPISTSDLSLVTTDKSRGSKDVTPPVSTNSPPIPSIRSTLMESFKIRGYSKTLSSSRIALPPSGKPESPSRTASVNNDVAPAASIASHHTSLIGGILTRIRGNTVDSTSRAVALTAVAAQIPVPRTPSVGDPSNIASVSSHPTGDGSAAGKSLKGLSRSLTHSGPRMPRAVEPQRRGGLSPQNSGLLLAKSSQDVAKSGDSPPPPSSPSGRSLSAIPASGKSALQSKFAHSSLGFNVSRSRLGDMKESQLDVRSRRGDDDDGHNSDDWDSESNLTDSDVVTCSCGSKKFVFTVRKKLVCVECKAKIDV